MNLCLLNNRIAERTSSSVKFKWIALKALGFRFYFKINIINVKTNILFGISIQITLYQVRFNRISIQNFKPSFLNQVRSDLGFIVHDSEVVQQSINPNGARQSVYLLPFLLYYIGSANCYRFLSKVMLSMRI